MAVFVQAIDYNQFIVVIDRKHDFKLFACSAAGYTQASSDVDNLGLVPEISSMNENSICTLVSWADD